MTKPAAIDVKGLRKTYGAEGSPNRKEALKGIDLSIPQGSIFGLLGPNGAGKSTFINILAGMVTKTAGTASVWGFDIDTEQRNAKASIGIVPQEISFDAFFTPFEVLELQAGLYGVPPKDRRSMEILEMVQLADKANAYSRTLSGGMKRRLLVAKAMVHSPPILVLDEPTAGVDVELRQQLWENVRALHAMGITIVLTTHYLEEAEELCDTIAIINHGELVCCEPTPAILSRIDEKELVITTDSPLSHVPTNLEGLHAHLPDPHRLVIQINQSVMSIGQVLDRVREAGIGIKDLSTNETDLEDIFLQLTQSQSA